MEAHVKSLRLGGVQTREYSQHAAVGVLALREIELHEDVANVGFDRTLAEAKALGDAGVRQPLGHKLEHLVFALGQRRERIVIAAT